MAAKQVTFHFQRTPDAGLPAERAIWGDAEAEQVLLLHERGHVLHRSVRRPASGNSFRLVMYEYGPEAEHGQLVASGALYIERAFAAVAFVPGSSSRIFFALEHSAQLLSADLPIAEPAVAQVPVIPVAVAVHQSSICSIACSGAFRCASCRAASTLASVPCVERTAPWPCAARYPCAGLPLSP